MDADEALSYARVATANRIHRVPPDYTTALVAEVESLRAAVARVRELCAERTRQVIEYEAGTEFLSPTEVLRALDGEAR